jgi:hypothetical protein
VFLEISRCLQRDTRAVSWSVTGCWTLTSCSVSRGRCVTPAHTHTHTHISWVTAHLFYLSDCSVVCSNYLLFSPLSGVCLTCNEPSVVVCLLGSPRCDQCVQREVHIGEEWGHASDKWQAQFTDARWQLKSELSARSGRWSLWYEPRSKVRPRSPTKRQPVWWYRSVASACWGLLHTHDERTIVLLRPPSGGVKFVRKLRIQAQHWVF